jgi:hypothetical protein
MTFSLGREVIEIGPMRLASAQLIERLLCSGWFIV